MKEADRRNLDPTPAAVVAMFKYSDEYAAQRGGIMDFWDTLDASRKRLCEEMVARFIEAQKSHAR